ncbi:acetyl-CoA carboxylase biotin carboxylase subunit family protein [Streptomyces sp. NPDC057963]|uniref:ATP-grasp domain-containing protein n=1 Tax=Streptomyces sp. NPDC057963 TaxID=3346290 RepID=UPI0036E55DBC
MTYLVMNRRPIIESLAKWFPRSKDDLVVVTDRRALRGVDTDRMANSFRALEVTDDYGGKGTERLVESLCQEHRVERILTTAEVDLVRSAELRGRLGLPGQNRASAVAYTDKHIMKTAAATAGLPTAPMRTVHDAAELIAFAAAYGLPVVLKELNGAAAIGMSVLKNDTDLAKAAGRWGQDRPGGVMLAESWVDGDVYHVNGLVAGGSVLQSWPCRYLHTQWSSYHSAAPCISGMLHPEEPLFDRLQNATAAVTAALPTASEVLPFHAEFFHSTDDTIILCEIACRAGGAGIIEMHERAFGLNLYHAGLKGQADRADDIRWTSLNTRGGYGWFPPQAGVLRQLPSRCPLPRAVEYTTSGEVGRRYPGPRSAVDAIAQLHFDIAEDEDLMSVLREVENWWADAVRWK